MDEQNRTVIYQGRPINVKDIPQLISSLLERSANDPDNAQKYADEAKKLIEFSKNL